MKLKQKTREKSVKSKVGSLKRSIKFISLNPDASGKKEKRHKVPIIGMGLGSLQNISIISLILLPLRFGASFISFDYGFETYL